LIVASSPHDPAVRKLDNALRALGEPQGTSLACYRNAESLYLQSRPELVFVCLGSDPGAGLELLQNLRGHVSGALLAVGQASDPKLILRVLQVGADLFLDEADLEVGLEAGLSRLRGKADQDGPTGLLFAVLAASGGCGASTVAVNLASVLGKSLGESLLVDLKPGRGDLAALLALKPQYTLLDICAQENRLDRAMFAKMLVRHPSGIQLLGAAPQFGDARAITPRGVAQALLLARRLFPAVLVDLEDCFHEEQTAVLQQATAVLLVSRLDFTSLRNMRRILEALAGLAVPKSRIKLVVNQCGQPNELPIDEAEDALGEKIQFFIPSDPKSVNLANNLGLPVVLKEPGSKVAQSFVQLANRLTQTKAKTSSLVRRLIGR
jgi:pilus assembly protein CpaE